MDTDSHVIELEAIIYHAAYDGKELMSLAQFLTDLQDDTKLAPFLPAAAHARLNKILEDLG